VKERETLDVLKELESTKRLVENLKSKLQKEESEAKLNFQTSVCNDMSSAKEDKKNQVNNVVQDLKEGGVQYHSSAPGLILKELEQAKLNLNRTTSDIADVRASVESLNKKLEKERLSLEKTRERLTQNSSKICCLEEELNQTKLKLVVAKDAGLDNPSDITKELHRLSSEAENFKRMGEAAKSEVSKAMSEIEQTKAMIKTAEIRLVAARKIKEAARAAEAAALAEMKALSHNDNSPGEFIQKHDGITLSFEEYAALTCKAREAEEHSKKRVVDAMLLVDEANVSKMDIVKKVVRDTFILCLNFSFVFLSDNSFSYFNSSNFLLFVFYQTLMKVEEATEEVKTSKKALEEALERVEAANLGKLAVEEALRKWRSDGHRRRSSIHNSTKFKNAYPSHHRKESRLLDVNGLNLVHDEVKPVLKPTLSIGQILSRKLMMPEECEGGAMVGERVSVKRKVSLGQMLGRENADASSFQAEKENVQKPFSAKRKKFGFGRFSLLLTKQQKKKKPTLNLR